MNQPHKQAIPTSEQHIALVSSMWHANLVARAREAFVKGMRQHGCPPESLVSFEVPGAFEIPLRVKSLALSRSYAAIVAFGLIVDGGIYRHDFVASAVIDGLMRVQLDTDVPVLSVVLTPQSFHEHEVHQHFFEGHLTMKGEEAVRACLQVLESTAAQPIVS